jgi:hypothetical protein
MFVILSKKYIRFAVKQNEFNDDDLPNSVAHFFPIFVIVLFVKCEKIWRLPLTERRSTLEVYSEIKIRKKMYVLIS